MKLAAPAGSAATAIEQAVLAVDESSKLTALAAVRVAAGEGTVSFTCDRMSLAITVKISAAVERSGQVAVRGSQIAALLAGFPRDATVSLSVEGTVLAVRCGRSAYKLPTIPISDLPRVVPLDRTGEVRLAKDAALELIQAPLFACDQGKTRFYLAGIFLHAAGAFLHAVGTDGHRLYRTAAPLDGDWPDPVIVPREACPILAKLMRRSKTDTLVWHCSPKGFEVVAPDLHARAKVVDAKYPDYAALIARPSPNHATVERRALLQALHRLRAVIDPGIAGTPLAALQWSDGVLRVFLARQHGAADDTLAAATEGAGRFAAQLAHLQEITEAIDAERLTFDQEVEGAVVRVSSPDAAEIIGIQCPVTWSFRDADH